MSASPSPRPAAGADRGPARDGAADGASLYAAHRDRVRRHLARTVPAAEVDDLVQEVFVKVQRGLAGFRGGCSLVTWILRIAAHTACDHLRSRRHRESRLTASLSSPVEPDSAGGPCAAVHEPSEPAQAAERLVRNEMCGCLREYLDRLPPGYRDVLRMKDIEGMTSGAIAARLGLSLPATKIRLHRARAAYRRLLETDCELYRTAENTLACDRRDGARVEPYP